MSDETYYLSLINERFMNLRSGLCHVGSVSQTAEKYKSTNTATQSEIIANSI